uniref:HMA domain-containing protein n=1 Tax=Ananas comosus var. bracteatus TaxID=296719 RepID=A0A6V7NG60_ANACO|nr:unnamed protein product [Ananas comosus var. bracteatus]
MISQAPRARRAICWTKPNKNIELASVEKCKGDDDDMITAPRPSVSVNKPQDQVVVLRVSLHCKGCEAKLRKHLSKMEGVKSFHIDFATKKVTVIGDVTPLSVLNSITKVKNAQFWPSPPPLGFRGNLINRVDRYLSLLAASAGRLRRRKTTPFTARNGVPSSYLPFLTPTQTLQTGEARVINEEFKGIKIEGIYVSSLEEDNNNNNYSSKSYIVAMKATWPKSIGGGLEDSLRFFGVLRPRVGGSESHIAVVGGAGKYSGANGIAVIKAIDGGESDGGEGFNEVIKVAVYLN